MLRVRISSTSLSVQAEELTPCNAATLYRRGTHNWQPKASGGSWVKKRCRLQHHHSLRGCRHVHTHATTHAHTCVNTGLKYLTAESGPNPHALKTKRCWRAASPGPLVCDGNTHVLRGHCCPLLGLHDEGFCVHQAKSIEMAN